MLRLGVLGSGAGSNMQSIVDAIAEANARGSGVASLKGKMIDKPVVERARYLLELARMASGGRRED